ncbi:hypothetical protein KM043_009053 [Ampulex compressa]|nr:hypothetical protein KM043_009053 [Ampulex compressa]
MVMEEQNRLDMELASERVPVPQVKKPSNVPIVETSNKPAGVSRGKPRLRKKALHAAILKQMEFYFSDANLGKDRYLGSLIKNDPYVDLSVFVKFNKIIELTTDVSRIAKALDASTMLRLSEDGTKVCRVTPVKQKENIDDCTIYVQNLPPDTNHEMLSSIFSQYGPVVYVSVPRYKSNKKIKGFAFVEFEKPDDVEKCIQVFKKKGCVLPSYTSPTELLSITTFDDIEKDVTLGGRSTVDQHNMLPQLNSDADIPKDIRNTEKLENGGKKQLEDKDNIMESDTGYVEIRKTKKRKHKTNESVDLLESEESVTSKELDTDIIKSKKRKAERSTDSSDGEATIDQSKNEDENTNCIKDKNKDMDETNIHSVTNDGLGLEEQDTNNKNEHILEDQKQNSKIEDITMNNSDEQDNIHGERKKKRKRKRRNKIEDVSYNVGFQIMAKKDWKHLRNKYLELQRSKMKQLKQYLRKTRWSQWPNYDKNKMEKEENEEKEKQSKQDNTNNCRFTFTPGVIVKIEMDEPCVDPKSFKTELKSNSSVKYIDVTDGSYQAFIRCDAAEAAQSFVQKSNEKRRMTVLEGDEEQAYWTKMQQDREDKLGKKVRIKQRGRNKLLKKAEKALGKHIKFDEV